MKSFICAAAAVVTGVLLASAGLAAAQAPPVAPGPVAQGPVAQGPGAQGPAAQGQAQDLPTLLHLRPDQMAAYRAVEAASHDSPALVAQMKAKFQRLPSETFPQRLDFQAELLNLQVAHTRRVMEAQRKFYAVLTPAQQHMLDKVTAPRPQQVAPQH